MFTCEKCGAVLQKLQGDSTIGMICPNCFWSVVSTRISPILLDETDFHVYLKNGNPKDSKHIKVVSKISGKNFLSTRATLMQAEPLIFIGKATQVSEIKELLDTNQLIYNIRPDWPY
ncbi:hypothetical protein E8L90_18225 [Brevibacillus antibioticus]|uniref:Uncharacterized protein n=1 Tax=Brevibacillus antibioticus TaxID=2570228 RepID=A0A4U2Y981_9BACL|nr:hypothetical protein [Brevibacillus antibioticus]TKI57237.1 hypothetical protein E8L90_18225 [Brevibacillus antibioticus]